jgi:hypothetical protein
MKLTRHGSQSKTGTSHNRSLLSSGLSDETVSEAGVLDGTMPPA